jgi:hypothetical protein
MCELHVINNLWIYLSNSGGQRLVVEEIARPGPPAALTGIERRRRHGEIDVRVEVEPVRTGSRHRHCPASALELPVVAAEGLNRRPASGA